MAEELINRCLKQSGARAADMFSHLLVQFDKAIRRALLDPEMAGFKSVICYRTGLDISPAPLSSLEGQAVISENLHRPFWPR